MDFDFRSFSTRSFERFSQAMALHVLGKGVLVFGDGPDGAREAAYEGTLSYPSEADSWSGYTVMQAKFRQVPGSPQEDADWLVAQLSAEFDKFLVPNSTLQKPDFYIIVTNARLSPLPASKRGKGGIAKIDAVFAKYKQKIGFKDYRVWHLDQLTTMLMTATELRRSYAAWLCSSDVIAEILDDMHARSKIVSEAMYRYLARELRTHQPVRLQQAGHSSHAQIMIEDVFIDLPYRLYDRADYKNPPEKLLLSTLLDRSRDCLDAASIKEQQESDSGRPERILLLGGPGQGKSTLSQFLAQIFRANILHSERAGKHPAEITQIINSTLSKAKAANLSIEVPRRFPLRVDLPNYADWLSSENHKNGAHSLLHYLAKNITDTAHSNIEIEDLRHWISSFPSILILDGLDEVPPSANRGDVLRAINEFWDEATSADLLMIVTTRPQGYNDDLDPSYYSKLEMTPLVAELALAYARKLAAAQIVEPSQCDRVINRLEEAARSSTTTRLMVSPLQVAILLALIDLRGDVPTDRWSLFNKYFEVVLQREQAKTGSVGETMRHWARQISAIHYKAGFLLHVEAETNGNSEAYLSRNELEALIQGQLIEDEFEGQKLRDITTELLAASTERLVLIVQRADDRFSFEVRSLQEFMSAAHLMNGREQIVQERLRTIAHREHWLHVFQIAASKCFSINDSQQYRDTIVTICSEINENGENVDCLLLTGSRLALALLDDGLAYDQPRYRKMLLSTAFKLLLGGPDHLPASLCDHCAQDSTRTIEQLQSYLSSTLEDPTQAAWKLILLCLSKGQTWPNSLIDTMWPQNPSEAIRLITYGIQPPANSSLYKRIRRALENTPPSSTYQMLHSTDANKHVIKKTYPCLTLLCYPRHEKLNIKVKTGGHDTPITIHLTSTAITPELRPAFDDLPDTPLWAAMRALRSFQKNPSKIALADLLESIVNEGWQENFEAMLSNLPWILRLLLLLCQYSGDPQQIAQETRAGIYGDIADWGAAEQRWLKKGVTDEDLKHLTLNNALDAHIAHIGAPPILEYSVSHNTNEIEWADHLFSYGMAAKGLARYQLRRMLAFALTVHEPQENISLPKALFLFEEEEKLSTHPHWIRPEVLTNLPLTLTSEKELLQRLDQLGRLGNVHLPYKAAVSPTLYQQLAENLGEFPGLLVFLVNFLATDPSTPYSQFIKNIELKFFSQSENSVFAKYSKVLSILSGEIHEKTVEMALKDKAMTIGPNSNKLLSLFLNNESFGEEQEKSIIEAIISVIKRNPSLPRSRFMQKIQTFANSRQAELHQETVWNTLQLGENLLQLTARRKTHEH